jgi:RNA polymerase sigma factor (sigma-70 family)
MMAAARMGPENHAARELVRQPGPVPARPFSWEFRVNDDLFDLRDSAIRQYRHAAPDKIPEAVTKLIDTVYRTELAAHADRHLSVAAEAPELLRDFAKHLGKPSVKARWDSNLMEWFPWALGVLSEVASIRKYQTGNPQTVLAAVTHLIHGVYKHQFLRHARTHVRQPADVDDLLQKLVVHLSRPEIRDHWNSDRGEWLSWARRVMSGLASDDRKMAATRTRHTENYLAQARDDAAEALSIEDEVANREFWRTLHDILDNLRDSPNPHEKLCYEVFIRRLDHEQTLQNLADGMGLTISQVRTLILHSNQTIRQKLADQGFDEPPPTPYRRPDPPSSED